MNITINDIDGDELFLDTDSERDSILTISMAISGEQQGEVYLNRSQVEELKAVLGIL